MPAEMKQYKIPDTSLDAMQKMEFNRLFLKNVVGDIATHAEAMSASNIQQQALTLLETISKTNLGNITDSTIKTSLQNIIKNISEIAVNNKTKQSAQQIHNLVNGLAHKLKTKHTAWKNCGKWTNPIGYKFNLIIDEQLLNQIDLAVTNLSTNLQYDSTALVVSKDRSSSSDCLDAAEAKKQMNATEVCPTQYPKTGRQDLFDLIIEIASSSKWDKHGYNLGRFYCPARRAPKGIEMMRQLAVNENVNRYGTIANDRLKVTIKTRSSAAKEFYNLVNSFANPKLIAK